MAGRGYFPTFKAFATLVSVYIVVHDASSGQAHYCRWEVRLLEGGTSNDVTGGVVPKEARANNLVEWMELARSGMSDVITPDGATVAHSPSNRRNSLLTGQDNCKIAVDDITGV